jgi:Ser/Thr protein kinase RdoA (MazF antagonist)
MSRKFKKQTSPLINKAVSAKILSSYFVSGVKFKYSLINKGLENVNVLVDLSGEKYVIRIYNPIKFEKYKRTRQSILYEIEFMNYLREHDLPIPRIIQAKSKKLFTSIKIGSTRYFCSLTEYVEGREGHITKRRILAFAPIQAKMHLLSLKFKPRYSKRSDGANDYYIWWSEFKLSGKGLKDLVLDQALTELMNKILNKVNPKTISKFPIYIIHSDLHKENMRFIEDRVVGIFDFDDCREGILPEDIAMFLHEILKHARSYEHIKADCQLFFDSYEKVRPLSRKEKEMAIYFAMMKIYELKYFDIYYSELAGEDLSKKILSIYRLIGRYPDFVRLAKFYN